MPGERHNTEGAAAADNGHPPGRENRRVAYNQIIGAQQAVLLRAARRLCGGREDDAQDLVQDAFIKGYAAYLEGRFQEGTNVRAWLLRILTNNFITEYNRRRKWEADVDVETLGGESGGIVAERFLASLSERPEAALMASTLDEPLEKALGTLSPELRACVTLVDIEELDYAEAATALSVPIGTIRSRLFRARKHLHDLLYEYAHSRRRTPVAG